MAPNCWRAWIGRKYLATGDFMGHCERLRIRPGLVIARFRLQPPTGLVPSGPGVSPLATQAYIPHIDLLLRSLRINRERLTSRSKLAIEARLLCALLQELAAWQPFSVEFYLKSYPDIADAYAAGTITDLHRHFIDSGYLEGRLGAPVAVDEAFYCATYPDIAEAIALGTVASATEHYLRCGAAEGRLPAEALRPVVEHWMGLLNNDPPRG